MDEQIEPADAARALDEIGRRREQAIRRGLRAAFPRWQWWATAVLMIAFTAAVEFGGGLVVGIGLGLFVVGLLAVNVLVSRRARAAPPHGDLYGPGSKRRALVGMASFLAVLVAVLLTTGLSLKAAGVPYPATIAVTVTAVVFVAGGQLLVRHETAVMLRRSGSAR